jgi:hypothetical protein
MRVSGNEPFKYILHEDKKPIDEPQVIDIVKPSIKTKVMSKKKTNQINLDMTAQNDVTILSTDKDDGMSDAKSIISVSSVESTLQTGERTVVKYQ